ncbi:hypothetical protein GCM10012275_02840 [Longimycelium tulufanense]|uniref:ABC transporter n=1 Tax=Longimycelium tulufanense TaxID=907463 RepID=A0A8J3FS83_9PSEU|nr:hypothetical protein [Longimycelium tulufanense]GGM35037.1 hypothetical protein GCM10012275_02840 [Longimycelium tulufanense]
MTALVRYQLAVLTTSQRFLPPLLLFLVTIAVLNSDTPDPLLHLYGISAGVLLPVTTWLTVALVNGESPEQLAISSVTARGHKRTVVASVLSALCVVLVLTAVALGVPLMHTATPTQVVEVVDGLLSHLTSGLAGIAAGLLCSRPLIRRPGTALAAGLVLVLALAFLRNLPPVNTSVRLLLTGGSAPDLPDRLASDAAVALILLTASAVVTVRVRTVRGVR